MAAARLVIGLTGGVASGKSSVARAFEARHPGSVVDADLAARAVVEPGTEGLAAVIAAFGADVLGPDGRLDRTALRARVFGDAAQRKALGLRQHAVAEQAGITPESLSRFERGRGAEFGSRKLLAVLAVLGMEINFVPVGQSGTLDELRRERNQA
jgi:hypothetical protein